MSRLAHALDALKRHFGFESFREGQDLVIEAILGGENALVVMPTGGGKSLCYQLPATIREGTTIVVSPLIALMKDQVDALVERGISATFINSSIAGAELSARLATLREGGFRLVYIAPERFRSDRFLDALSGTPVSMLAIDEAHCISEWGHDFRPDYRRLREARTLLGSPQTVALTATATPEVRADIATQLDLGDVRHFIAGFDRPNLTLRVAHTKTEREKLARTVEIAKRSGGSGIVYAATRKTVDTLASALGRHGIRVAGYHAGLDDRERVATQESFMEGRVDVIVATNAFGMGIDKPDIRFVVHAQMPGSIEAYYQEIGRAGRDGQPATCTLLFNYADSRFQQFFIEGSFPPPELVERVYDTVAGLGPGRHDVPAREIASLLGLRNDMAVNSALVLLDRARHIDRGRGGERGLLVLDARKPPALRIDRAEMARRAASEARKLRRVIDFAYHKGCLRRFVLSYFGDQKGFVDCGRCSGCDPVDGGYDPLPDGAGSAGGTLRVRTSRPSKGLHDRIIDAAPTGDDLRDHLRRTSSTRARTTERSVRIDEATRASDRPVPELGEPHATIVVKILSCVARTRGRYGKGIVASVLRGSRAHNVLDAGLDRLSTYGLLADKTQDELLAWCDALVDAGLIEVSRGAYPTVSLTDRGSEVMKRRSAPRIDLARRGLL